VGKIGGKLLTWCLHKKRKRVARPSGKKGKAPKNSKQAFKNGIEGILGRRKRGLTNLLHF